MTDNEKLARWQGFSPVMPSQEVVDFYGRLQQRVI